MFTVQKMKHAIADPTDNLSLQVPRALIASVLALAFDFCLYVVCFRLAGMPATMAAVCGYLMGGLLQYMLCSVWVFANSSRRDALGFVAFTILSLVGLGITWIVILVAHDWFGVPAELAKCAAVGLAFTWNFLSRKFLLFRPEVALASETAAVRGAA